MFMRFGTWNVRSLDMIVPRELSRYRLELVGVPEIIFEDSGTEPAEE
jgi:hypothetical protein